MSVTFALLGAGFIGREHARNILANPHTDLALVCDPSEENGRALAERTGARYSRTVDAEGLAGVDAVLIASATAAHPEQIVLAAQAGKPLLCEKPISGDFQTGLGAVREAMACGVFGAVGFNRRFITEHALLRSTIAEGQLGRVETLRITLRMGELSDVRYIRDTGGLFHSVGSHFFDLACWLAGERPAEVFAAASYLVDPSYRDAGVHDTALITLKMPSGALAALELSMRSDYGYDERIEVHGSKGTGFSEAKPAHGFVLASNQSRRAGPLVANWYERMGDCYARELDAFLEGMAGKANRCAPLVDGLRADILADAATQSAASNAVVKPDWSVIDAMG